ncbi:DUF664 domain-containing protein [Allobranchiibius sp. GilTou73]|uniref:mycothiol transferase n=1 Tax=Allobranchiibius sp. GilTou73 TaxID=2904523 RepID=UPI001F383457|nr:DUF664 domain-containing protein [Allobranchiibius sp. GilTou73]UIJ35009.1 DinB family protein [Allobranchiibius sp. GilTou73]
MPPVKTGGLWKGRGAPTRSVADSTGRGPRSRSRGVSEPPVCVRAAGLRSWPGLQHWPPTQTVHRVGRRSYSDGHALGGLLKHVVATERSWIRTDVERGEEEPRTDEFTLGADETVAQWLAAWELESAHTEEVVRSGIDLDQEVPDYQGGASNNVRWVLLHLVEEMARHAGHADLLREAIDGRTYRR